MDQFNILVTGVGAVIGYGIIKSLKKSRYNVKIIGIDIFEDAVGRVWCDKFVQGVRADSEQFPEFITKLVKKFDIDLIIPGIEQDVDAFGKMVYKHSFNACKIALNTKTALKVFNNKRLTYRLLNELGLPFIQFALSQDLTEKSVEEIIDIVGLPCIVKPDISYARKGLATLVNREELQFYNKQKGYVFQKKINSGIEYTISVFGLGNGKYCNPICLKRQLGPDGATHKAEVFAFSPFEFQIKTLMERIKPSGPTNFQFIENDSDNSVLLLEVNPRISASTSIRTGFGVNEAEMCIDFFLADKEPIPVKIKKGRAQRFLDEIMEYDSNNI